jgi:hypothetical protein
MSKTKIKFLYYGTNERAGKSVPATGISSEKIVLTNLYGAYQAFCDSDAQKDERWAIVEISVPLLINSKLSYYKRRGCKKVSWDQSIENTGLCVYNAKISPKSISKIWIYNPLSNWLITRSVLHNKIDPHMHSSRVNQLLLVNRWLTGEFMMSDIWIKEQKIPLTKEQKDSINFIWHERHGLDLFYQSHQK